MPSGRLHRLRHLDWRSSDFWLRCGCVAVIAFSLLQLLLFAHGRDQSIYATIADGMLEGEMPYRDRWDFKPPGIFFIYALARALFGNAMWGVRVLEAVGLVLVCWAGIRLSKTFFADDRPGYLGAAVATLVHVQMEFWHSGQPEAFGGVFTVLGLWACIVQHPRASRQWGYWLLCGLCFGIAFLLKPPLGGGALICAVHLATNRRELGIRASLAPLCAITVGALVPILVTVAWFAGRGAWPALSWTLFEFTPGYTKLGWNDNAPGGYYRAIEHAFLGYSALNAVGAAAAAIGLPTSSREREGLTLLLGVIAIHLAGVAMQAKFFPYHFDATLMLVGLVAGLGWFKIWRKAMSRGAAGAVAFASLAMLTAVARLPVNDVPHGFWERGLIRLRYVLRLDRVSFEQVARDLYRAADYDLGANRDVARRVKELTTKGDHVFVWGFEPLIYLMSERRPSSRFIYNVPQRTTWGRDHARAVLMSELLENPPKVFVVQHDDYFRFVTGNDDDSFRAVKAFPELAAFLEKEYRYAERIQDFDLHLRIEP